MIFILPVTIQKVFGEISGSNDVTGISLAVLEKERKDV